MAAENFQLALKRVLVYEGGYSNHPKDPGGVTLEGVIQRVYDGWRKTKGLPRKALTPQMRGTAEWIAERDAIYKQNYWDPIKGDTLPSGVDFVVFDGAVNSGPSQSVKWLQRALRMNVVDGNLGPSTLGAACASSDPDILVRDICDRRMAFLKALKTWSTFGKGWASRVADVRGAGNALAFGSIPAAAKFAALGNAKARASDAKAPPSRSVGASIASGGGVATIITQVTDTVAPVKDSSPTLATIFTVLTVLGVLLTIGGIAYNRWAASRRAELADALDAVDTQDTAPDAPDSTPEQPATEAAA